MKKIIISGLMLSLILTGCIKKAEKPVVLGVEEIKVKMADFVNKNLMQPGSEVTVKEVTEEGELYKIIVAMSNGQDITSYATKDGEKIYTQVFVLDEYEKKAEEAKADAPAPEAEATVADVPKAEMPKVELFVMSHCPYGTQIEKGILPVLETLGDKLDFELKFCDYAMHGEKELDEQLNQYCLQKNEPEKLLAYLKCFLSADEGEKCLAEVKANSSKLKACVAETDEEFKVKSLFADQSTWKSGRFPQFNVFKADTDKYGISGSPSIVINGKKVSTGRDSAGLLKAICAGYETQPEECAKVLSADAPTPGFGFGGTGTNAAAECGS